jgi:hypothetical protein
MLPNRAEEPLKSASPSEQLQIMIEYAKSVDAYGFVDNINDWYASITLKQTKED